MGNENLTVRLLNFNLWHGLDHTKPLLMPPLEDTQTRDNRFLDTLDGLQEVLGSRDNLPSDRKKNHLDFLCLQELNPIHQKALKIHSHLQTDGYRVAEGNVGMRVGDFSFPPFLQEGLGMFWKGRFEKICHYRWVLSGPFFETQLPVLGIPISTQLKERRVALCVCGQWQNLNIAVVTTHLHHGNPEVKSAGLRREQEIKNIFLGIGSINPKPDLIFLAGDFNCFLGISEFDLFKKNGFEELSLSENGNSLATWDPNQNPLSAQSRDLSAAPLARAWDNKQNAFDHIFWRPSPQMKKEFSDLPQIKSEITLNRPGPRGHWPSDHFGILTQITFRFKT